MAGVMAAANAALESQMNPDQLAEHRAKQAIENAKFKEEHPYAGLSAILMIAASILIPALALAMFFAVLLFRK